MAYSMAGVIAMCGSKKKMVDYGTFMMHNASFGFNHKLAGGVFDNVSFDSTSFNRGFLVIEIAL